MKTLVYNIFFFSFLISLPGLEASPLGDLDEFQVIFSRGKILHLKSRKALKRESTFYYGDTLSFSSISDRVIVSNLSQSGKCYILTPKENLQSYEMSFCEARVGTRPGNLIHHFQLKAFFEGRTLLILNGEIKIKIKGNKFPIDNNNFFFIRYDWVHDTLPVNKKLASDDGQHIIISKENLFKVDGHPISALEAKNFTLFHYKSKKKKSLRINKFDIRFPNEHKLEREIALIVQNSALKGEELFNQIDQYVNTVYGEPEVSDLKEWLKEKMQLTF